MDARQLSEWLLSQTEYDDRGLPHGWPAWWIEYLSQRPLRLREKVHRFVLLYAGRSATSEADISGLTPAIVQKLLSHRPVQRMLNELGKQLGYDAGALATKDEVLGFWSQCLRDDHLDIGPRHKAAEALAKALGVFVEKRQVELKAEMDNRHTLDRGSLEDAIARLRGDRYTEPPPPEPEDDASWME